MAGLINFNPNPLSMGLMNAGANMMMMGGPSRQRVNLGSALGGGMQGLLSGFTAQQQQDLENQYKQDLMSQRAQEFDLDQRYKMAQLDRLNNPTDNATPGQWYIPPDSTPFTDPATGFVGYKTKNGALIPSRFAETDYQAKMTDPNVIAQIARAREQQKIVKMETPEGAPYYGTGAEATGQNTNIGNMRNPGQSKGFADPKPFQQDLSRIKNQLDIYSSRGITTPRQIISTWSPPNENDTGRLINDFSSFTGLDPDKPINFNDPSEVGRVMYGIAKQEGNQQKVISALGGRPVGQSIAEKEAIKTDEALRQKKEEKKLEQASVAPEQLALLDMAESKIQDALNALGPSQELDKFGNPKSFKFKSGGFGGGGGLNPLNSSVALDWTNDPAYRTLETAASSEELKAATMFLKGQGQVTEGERKILSEMVALKPDKNRSPELYKKYIKGLNVIKKYKNLWRGRSTQGTTGGWGEDQQGVVASPVQSFEGFSIRRVK